VPLLMVALPASTGIDALSNIRIAGVLQI